MTISLKQPLHFKTQMHIELNLPEKKLGEWSIQSYSIDGINYQKLMKGNFLVMANTPDIVTEYEDFLTKAKGSVLINGLGMGLCCQYLLNKKELIELTVIEKEPSIVALIAPHFNKDKRCTIICGDAFNYQAPSGKMYDFVWHDIWYYYSSKNLEQIHLLTNKYAKIASWQGAWCEQKCRDLLQQENQPSL